MPLVISVDGFCLVCGRESSPAIAYTKCGRDMIYLPLVAGAAGRQADRQADRAAVGLLRAGQHTDYQPVGQCTTPPPPSPSLPLARHPSLSLSSQKKRLCSSTLAQREVLGLLTRWCGGIQSSYTYHTPAYGSGASTVPGDLPAV